jgi:hypothetical protein
MISLLNHAESRVDSRIHAPVDDCDGVIVVIMVHTSSSHLPESQLSIKVSSTLRESP